MKNEMLQQIMSSPKTIEFRTIPVPGLSKGQVLVKVMRIGICGSDIHVYHGTHPSTSYPVTQGHEVSCEIIKCSPDVEGFLPGQKCTIEPQLFCGKCYPCRNGKYNLCENLKVMGFQTTGVASEYFAVDASKITVLPEEFSHDEGCLIEPLAVAVHAVRKIGNVEGKNIAVIGSGPIGNLVMQTLKAYGATKVLMTDVSDFRLKFAGECGADYLVNTYSEDFSNKLNFWFGPDKADVIVDCAGNDKTIDQAIQNARKGSLIMLIAVFEKKAIVDLAKLNDSELNLDTSMMYTHIDFLNAIELVQKKKVNLQKMISKHFAFSDFQAAYEFIDKHRETTMKVIIDVN